MNLGILYADELSGFYKSRVMLVLWVGMPVMALVLHAVSPDLRGQMTLAQFSMLLIATIASTISAVMLSVGIITEKTRGVYALFLVRPVRRWCILVGKFLAVFTCVAVASVLTLLVGVLFDWLRGAAPDARTLAEAAQAAATSFASIVIASSAGILIGVLSPSVLVGAILVIYGANQLSAAGYIPLILKLQPSWAYSLGIGCGVSLVLLVVSIVSFQRKQI